MALTRLISYKLILVLYFNRSCRKISLKSYREHKSASPIGEIFAISKSIPQGMDIVSSEQKIDVMAARRDKDEGKIRHLQRV